MLFAAGIARADTLSSAITTASMSVARGISVVGVPLHSTDMASVSDIGRAFNAPVIAVARGNRWQVMMVDSPEARSSIVRGSEAYVLLGAQPRTIVVTGSHWGAPELVRSIPRGISLVHFFRPPIDDVETVRRAMKVLAILRAPNGQTKNQWQPIALEGATINRSILNATESYALISTTTNPNVLLPSVNHSPIVRIRGMPLAATAGTTLIFESDSFDEDPGDEALIHQWHVSSSGFSIRTTGSSIVLTMTTNVLQVQHTSSDGVLADQRTQSVAVIPIQTGVLQQEIRSGFGPFALNVFGMRAQLPALSVVARTPPSAIGYRARYDPVSIPIPGARHIDVEEAIQYLVPNTDPRVDFSIPITLSVDVGTSPTVDFLVQGAVASDSRKGISTRFDYYAFSQESTPRSSGIAKGPIAWARTWITQLGNARRTFVPVSLQNIISEDDGYAIEPENPRLLLNDEIVVLLISGIDLKSEFCAVGQTIGQALGRWDAFCGRSSASPSGIADNMRDMEQWFRFYRVAYPTTRTPREAAQRIASRLKLTLLAEGSRRRIIIFGYSMGGIVGRYLQNELDGMVEWLVTIGTPHHGSSIATALVDRYFDKNFFLQRVMPHSEWPLLRYGCIPPSDGLSSLVFDASWKDSNGRSLYPRRNDALTAFNERDDAHRNNSNVIHVAGGTGDIPFPNPDYEVARTMWPPPYGIVENEYSDGAVSTGSALPRDLHGLQKGSADPFFGWTDSGTVDRVSYNDGEDHHRILVDPQMVARFHTFVSQVIDHANHAPVDQTPRVIMLREDESTLDLVSVQQTTDEDGDPMIHSWSLHRVLPDTTVATIAGNVLQLETAGNAILRHTVRDGRGGISTCIIIVYRPELPTDGFCHTTSLGIKVRIEDQEQIHWSVDPRGCIPTDPRTLYTLWIDPTDDSTKIDVGNFYVYSAYHWWSDMDVYAFYRGPTITDGQITFSNVAVGKSQHTNLLNR